MIFRVIFKNTKAFEETYPDPFYNRKDVIAEQKRMKRFMEKFINDKGEIMIDFCAHQNKAVVIPLVRE